MRQPKYKKPTQWARDVRIFRNLLAVVAVFMVFALIYEGHIL